MRQFRFVHCGVIAALAVAGVSVVQTLDMVRATGSGTASVFVPIVPCRLADTRSGTDHVGVVTGPLATQGEATFAVWGTNGNCTIPNTATGIATNVTIANPTGSSYLTVYPADAPRPTASNLNWTATSSPTPNQVTVGLSAAGAIKTFNLFATVDVIIDVVGYYEPAGSGAQGPQGPPGVDGVPGPTGILRAEAFAGKILGTTVLDTGGVAFLGQTTVLNTEAGQRLFATATGTVGTTDASVTHTMWIDLCYQASPALPAVQPTRFSEATKREVTIIANQQTTVTATESTNPGAGTWKVGLCVGTTGQFDLDLNDYGNGWVIVV